MVYSELRTKLEGAACELITHAYRLSAAERTVRLHEIGLLAGQTLDAAEDLPNAAMIAATIDALLHRVQSHVGTIDQCEMIRQLDPLAGRPQVASRAN